MNQKQASPWETIGFGALAAVIGFYLVLAALSLLPAPGGPDTLVLLALAVGFCFLLGGLGVLVPAAVTGEVSSNGELPAGAPYWLRVFQYLLVS